MIFVSIRLRIAKHKEIAMKALSTYLAWRFLWFKGKDKNISFMIKICFLSIFIGTFSLMLTLIIMNGFEKVTHEKMQGINAHIIISSPGNRLNYDELRPILQEEFPATIAQVSGNSTRHVIIDRNDTQSILIIRGFDVNHEEEVSTLASKIIHPTQITKPILPKLLQDNRVLIGHKTAAAYKLQVGDKLNLLIPEAGGKKKIFLNKKTVEVGGIFRIGIEDYDDKVLFSSLSFVNTLFDEQGVEHITIKLKPFTPPQIFQFQDWRELTSLTWWKEMAIKLSKRIKRLFIPFNYEQAVIHLLQERFPHLAVYSWKDLYPDLVSSLVLEKYVMFFILALITLVAALNMISLLFMQIQSKLRDIAIIKTMGMANKPIRSIFLVIGMTITMLASTCGLGLAALIGYLLERYPFIRLPDVYYVEYLPARMDGDIFLCVFIATIILGFLATWIPAQRTKRINIAKVLRQE